MRTLSFTGFYDTLADVCIPPPTKEGQITETWIAVAAAQYFPHLGDKYGRFVVIDILNARGYNLTGINVLHEKDGKDYKYYKESIQAFQMS